MPAPSCQTSGTRARIRSGAQIRPHTRSQVSGCSVALKRLVALLGQSSGIYCGCIFVCFYFESEQVHALISATPTQTHAKANLLMIMDY